MLPHQNQFKDSLPSFRLHDFSRQRPFSSFLPGIAGLNGIPMWVFYVNRGQAIASFGVRTKDQPILEFQPANKAYRQTALSGFRTFIKLAKDERQTRPEGIYEPFSSCSDTGISSREMMIHMNELELEEVQSDPGLQSHVSYFTLPGEPFAGLVRTLTLTNRTNQVLEMEVLDGLPVLIPFGADNAMLKEISRTIEAWMSVSNLEAGIPFYHMRASIEDRAEVEAIEAGHFALAFSLQDGKERLLSPLVDPGLVFAYNTTLTMPDGFRQAPLHELLSQQQTTSGKTPCAFFGQSARLEPSESLTIYSVFGHVGNQNHLASIARRLQSAAFLEDKRRQANQLAFELTQDVATHTGSAVFDAYCRQTYLDNLLRGGWPMALNTESGPVFYHVYSRKHGDLERDYNRFLLAAEPYSQGEGNYRDVNQNRRSDVLFNPQVAEFNLRAFMSLLQADGYNPLVVKGLVFTLAPDRIAPILTLVDQPDRIASILAAAFTPGQLLQYVSDHGIRLRTSPEDFLAAVLQHASYDFIADHGEGYWTDHWTYNLDLIDSFLAIYPDRKAALLFDEPNLPYYDSPFTVQPRSKKVVLANGKPRQYQAVAKDPEKAAMIASRPVQPHWMRTGNGQGSIYRTTLFEKLLLLALVKFTSLDPLGMGVEMEANKPGWYDALNGLPGLFGSSMPETYELLRLVKFLQAAVAEGAPFKLDLPVEVMRLLTQAHQTMTTYQDTKPSERDFRYWDEIVSAREAYRDEIRLGFAGTTVPTHSTELLEVLQACEHKLQAGIERAQSLNDGFPPTYFIYEVEQYSRLQDPNDQPQDDEPVAIRVERFKVHVLPAFLEGVVKAMKLKSDPKAALALYRQVKDSPLYDQKLHMYKVNASLASQPHEIGRARAFTPGWLENESIWLHMEYKYLLEVLRAGLYEQFFDDFRQALIPFQDPDRYGRSPLENSSFLVSSAHPDPDLHGAGFVARLSGATAEFLSMWFIMMAGTTPFFVQDGRLCLAFKPALPGWLFDGENRISFTFLGQCRVVYHNPQRNNTYRLQPSRAILHTQAGTTIDVDGPVIGQPYADMVRSDQIPEVHVYF